MTKSQITPFPLRLPVELREKLDAQAKQIGRSLQAEIIARLELTFDIDPQQVFSSMNTRGISLNYDELAEALMRKARDSDEPILIQVSKTAAPKRRAPPKSKPKG